MLKKSDLIDLFEICGVDIEQCFNSNFLKKILSNKKYYHTRTCFESGSMYGSYMLLRSDIGDSDKWTGFSNEKNVYEISDR